ncbi:MAG: ankyrin repeat domain-containing protein, partial [Myxococcales bacterium]|nr:ankyrin repeat domain-containing protein [Myxococcales bacterium]
AEVDAVNDYGHTPLLRAAMEGQAEVVGVLLEAGADPRHRDRAGRSARDWAEAEGHREVVSAHRRLV